MEELRSTDTLDREILEDARKKADRILRTADQASESLAAAWAEKTKLDIAELERKHASRLRSKESETMARLPLDERRERAERAQTRLENAMLNVLRATPRERLLSLVKRELAERADALPSSDLKVHAAAFAPGEVERLLADLIPVGSWNFAEGADSAGVLNARGRLSSEFPALVLEGGRVRVSVNISEAASELLSDKRAELTTALLGKGAVDD